MSDPTSDTTARGLTTAPIGTFDGMLDLGCYLEERGFRIAVGNEADAYQVVVFRNSGHPELTHWEGVPITYEHKDEDYPHL